MFVTQNIKLNSYITLCTKNIQSVDSQIYYNDDSLMKKKIIYYYIM